MKTRKASLNDLTRIYSLEKTWKAEGISLNMNQSSKKELLEAIKEKRVIVAEEGKIMGFLLFKLNKDFCELDSLYVEKSFRRKGAGKELMKTFLNLPSVKKYKTLYLHADSKEEDKLIKFYEQFGFKKIAVSMKRGK